MTVFVFIIESANREIFETEFENGEIQNISSSTYVEHLNIDNFQEMNDIVSTKFSDDVVTVFVDENYQVKYYYTEQGEEEYEKIQALEAETDIVQVCRSNWMEFLPSFGGLDDTANYVFVSSKNFKNVYDMANFLQLPINNNCYYIWNCKDIREAVNAESYYNIFSSTKRKDQIDTLGNEVKIDYSAINWIVEQGVSQIKLMIKAGLLNKEPYIQAFIDQWALNPHSYFSKGIITEYGLKPKPPTEGDAKILKGLTIVEQFNRSLEYRYLIVDIMSKILCKYGFEFGKLTTINGNPHTINFDFLLR